MLKMLTERSLFELECMPFSRANDGIPSWYVFKVIEYAKEHHTTEIDSHFFYDSSAMIAPADLSFHRHIAQILWAIYVNKRQLETRSTGLDPEGQTAKQLLAQLQDVLQKILAKQNSLHALVQCDIPASDELHLCRLIEILLEKDVDLHQLDEQGKSLADFARHIGKHNLAGFITQLALSRRDPAENRMTLANGRHSTLSRPSAS